MKHWLFQVDAEDVERLENKVDAIARSTVLERPLHVDLLGDVLGGPRANASARSFSLGSTPLLPRRTGKATFSFPSLDEDSQRYLRHFWRGSIGRTASTTVTPQRPRARRPVAPTLRLRGIYVAASSRRERSAGHRYLSGSLSAALVGERIGSRAHPVRLEFTTLFLRADDESVEVHSRQA